MQNETTFDARRAYQHLEKLCFPRMTGTEGEKAAAEYIEQHFNELGFQTERQEFVFSAFPLIYGIRLFGLALCASILCISSLRYYTPFISALLAVGAILVLFKASRWGSHVEKLFDLRFCKRRSENIIARLGELDDDRSSIVYMAHYDSKSQAVPIWLRAALGILVHLGALLVFLMILVHSSVSSSSSPVSPSPLSFLVGWLDAAIPYSAYVVCVVILLEQFSFTSNKSPGALDNASGVSVLLELARVLSASHNLNVNLIFVAAGAEELGLCGASRFIQKYESKLDKDKTWFMNYDSCGGSGDLAVLDRYGIPPKRTSKILNRHALDIAEANHIKLRSTSLPIGAGVDSIPIGFRGFEAITISSRSIRSLLKIHSKRDSIENINQAALESAGVIGQRIAKKLPSASA